MEIEDNKNIIISQEKINEIKRLINEKNKLKTIPSKILNRRYKKLQQLIEKDEFFSEDEIKMREPLLYYLYCGQYMKQQAENISELSFSGFLEELMMKEEYRQLLEDQYNQSREKYLLPKKMNYDEKQTQEEVEDNEDELIRLMHTKFLIGQETQHFNYDDIDQDESLDDRKIADQDDEDKYFDDEEEDDQIDPSQSEYTGIEDY